MASSSWGTGVRQITSQITTPFGKVAAGLGAHTEGKVGRDILALDQDPSSLMIIRKLEGGRYCDWDN